MITENSVTYQLIGNVARSTTDFENMTDGMIALVDAKNSVVTTASTTDRLRVAQRVNGRYVFSPYFVPAESQIVSQAYVAPVQQVTYLGNQESLGSGNMDDAGAPASYVLRITLMHTQGIFNNTPTILTIPYFNASGDAEDLANGLKDVFDKVMARQPRKYITAEVVDDGETTPSEWGIKFTGVAPDTFNPVTETPHVVQFGVTFERIEDKEFAEANTTPVETTTEPSPGLGTGIQVAYKEVYTTMNEGQPQVCSYPPTNYRRAGEVGSAYNLISISGVDEGYVAVGTGQKPVSKFNIIVALKDSTLDADLAEFETVLGV